MTKLNHNMNLQDAMEFVENKKAIFGVLFWILVELSIILLVLLR